MARSRRGNGAQRGAYWNRYLWQYRVIDDRDESRGPWMRSETLRDIKASLDRGQRAEIEHRRRVGDAFEHHSVMTGKEA
jgi:hypothetical protein